MRNFRSRVIVLRLIAIFLAVLQVFSSLYLLYNDDALSYIDIARAILDQRWDMAVNAYWSPAYSWLIACVFALAHPAQEFQIVALKCVNLIAFLFTLISFERFLSRLIDQRNTYYENMLPGAATIYTLCYCAFIALTFGLGGTHIDTPDMLSYGFIFQACAEGLIRPRSVASSLRLGLWLALGYLTKAILFPIGIFFLFCEATAGSQTPLKKRLLLTLVSFCAMLLVSLAHIIAISRHEGRLTLSEAGSLNYAWYVCRSAEFLYPGSTTGSFANPKKEAESKSEIAPYYPNAPVLMLESPRTYYFDAEEFEASTLSSWLVPHYWFKGFVLKFSGIDQFVATFASWFLFCRYLFLPMSIGALCFWILDRQNILRCHNFKSTYKVWFPALAALCLYGVALNCNTLFSTRYFCGFFVLIYASVVSAAVLDYTWTKRARHLLIGHMVTLVLLCVPLVFDVKENVDKLTTSMINTPWKTVEAMRALGVKDGGRLLLIDPGRRESFAILGNYKIVAETRDFHKLVKDADSSTKEMIAKCNEFGIDAIYINAAELPSVSNQKWTELVPGKRIYGVLTKD